MAVLIDPAAIPDLKAVDIEAVRAAAVRMVKSGAGLEQDAQNVNAGWQGLAAFHQAPEDDDLRAKTVPVPQWAAGPATAARMAARALNTYADEAERTKRALKWLRADATEFVRRMRALGDEWDKEPANVAENERLKAEAVRHETAWDQAGNDAAGQVRSAVSQQVAVPAEFAGAAAPSEEQAAKAADRDAADIKRALAMDDPEAARKILAAKAAAAAYLSGQHPAYLERLYAKAGDEIAGLGRWLAANPTEGKDPGQIFSPGDATTLAGFGAGLATLSRGKDGASIPPDLRRKLLSPTGDKFSHAMLIKHGPNGKKWGSRFLSEFGKGMLEWKRENPFNPGSSRHGNRAPGSSDWWRGFDLGVGRRQDKTSIDRGSNEALNKVLAAHDPTAAAMSRLGQNPEAARMMLADQEAARDLISNEWSVTDPLSPGKRIDVSTPAAEVIRAATADTDAKGAPEATRNLFVAAADWPEDMKNRVHPSQYLDPAESDGPPRSINRALAGMGVKHIEEMTSMTENEGGVSIVEKGDVLLSADDIRGYLRTVAKDPTAMGIFRGGVDRELTEAARQAISGDKDAHLRELGRLNGMTWVAQADEDYSDAEKKDAANARGLWLLEWASGAPGLEDAVKIPDDLKSTSDWVKWATSPGKEGLKDKILTVFDTGHAQRAEFQNEENYQRAGANLRLPVGQAIADAVENGRLDLPKEKMIPPELLKNGYIVLETREDHTKFSHWFDELPEKTRAKYWKIIEGFDGITRSYKRGG